ncbi:serine/threonine-protein kinase [Paraliomyxa miuraensis]|uniref:serine/threonine-protein kinase n=1 Tax=Paraliomyxa miuraensis TaxID=376150 RepID=UPI00225BCC2D|nr:serine/threonine-protein kinase [Paraliomyxa miuraensis]MCX4246348.1 tetratricopeptide repeat protein [Paraliomyxa miuraensis]
MTRTLEHSGDATLIGGEETSASLSAAHRVTSPVLPRGAALGRYVILDRLAAGGMGVVYRAIDPQLERMVALKLLRFGEDDDARAQHTRLLREAQAMARVRHPNVVVVYDVGVEEGRVYVAMELIEGQTLGAWLRAEPRPWSQVLEVFIAAGKGLAAAHEQRLVHRDFKPDNVMVTERGRVVVMDFGLARGHELPPDQSEDAALSVSGSTLLSSEITRVGALVGTPAYMSPEQLSGHGADARSDQFAFCVALFEGLYGERPFQADGVMALVLAITKGRIAELAGGARVPKWLHHVVLRGLRGDPDQRWPSMDALLEMLEDPPQRRRRRRLVQGAVVASMGGVLALAWARSSQHDERCTGAAERLEGVWDGELRARAQQMLAALERPWATTVVGAAMDELDRYAAAWMDMHAQACRATVVDGSQSQEAMDLRVACLEQARMELQAIASQIAAPDPTVARNAHELVRGLPALEACADLEGLRAEVPLPSDPEAQQTLEELLQRRASAWGVHQAGKYDEAKELIDQLGPEVEALDHPLLRGRFLLLRALNRSARGQYSESRADLEQALAIALEIGHGQTAFSAAHNLAVGAAQHEQRPGEALIYGRIAVALAGRRGAAATDPSFARVGLGMAQLAAGDSLTAEATLRRALELDPGTDPLLTRAIHNNLGTALQDRGQFAEALVQMQRTLEISIEQLGPDHPDQVTGHTAVAHALQRVGRVDEAETSHRRALELAIQGHGDQHPSVAMARFNLGTLLLTRERFAEAEEQMLGALRIAEAAMGPLHPQVGAIHGNLAGLLIALGRPKEAEEHARRGLESIASALGATHPRTGSSRAQLAQALIDQGRSAEAETFLEENLEVRRKALEPGNPTVLQSLGTLAELRIDRGRPADAEPLLEEALDGYARAERQPLLDASHARVRLLLARALWEHDEQRERAITLVEGALELVESEEDRAPYREWLKDHRVAGR